MIVISDTTPIISLLKTGHLGLLNQLYQQVCVPQAVWRELTGNPAYLEEAKIIETANFLSVVNIENTKSVNILRSVTGLDAGESEALILFDEQNANLLLMDERKGRSVAKQLHIKHIGTAGILMQAYDMKLMQQSEIEKIAGAFSFSSSKERYLIYSLITNYRDGCRFAGCYVERRTY